MITIKYSNYFTGIPFGPIVQSTRKIYEKKLQNVISGQNSQNITENLSNGTNGTDFGTPMREMTPLNDIQNIAILQNGNREVEYIVY